MGMLDAAPIRGGPYGDAAPLAKGIVAVDLEAAVVRGDILWSFVLVQSAPNGPAMPYRFGSTLDGRNVGMVSWCQSLGAYALLRPPGGQRCFLAQNMPPRAAPAAPAWRPPPVMLLSTVAISSASPCWSRSTRT